MGLFYSHITGVTVVFSEDNDYWEQRRSAEGYQIFDHSYYGKLIDRTVTRIRS